MRRLRETPTGTWIGHALITLGAGLVLGGWTWWRDGTAHVGLWYTLGAVLAAAYFVVREGSDRWMHRARGDYDTPGVEGVTPRIDRVGDLLGPLCVAAGSVVGWLLGAL